MGPGASFDPVWGLMAMYGIFELLVIALLVMPMPSNALRGNIQGAISKLWHEQEYVRKTSWVLLTLNSYYFYDATRNLLDANKVYAGASCDSQLMALYFQRNVLITGGSVFLHFVMRRLLDIQGQLFTMRQLAKEAAAAQQQLLGGSSSGPDTPLLEAHRALSLKLTRLARSSADGGEEERANKQR